jgi:hypothetical protein
MLRHFLLIPWLIQMYRCKLLVELSTWHKDGVNLDGMIWNVPDFMAWKPLKKNGLSLLMIYKTLS